MSGQYPYGNPQYPPPQNQIYPQLYNQINAPAPGQQPYPVPGQNPQYQYQPQPGFAYPGQPGQHGAPPSAMSYPGFNPTPTAPPAYSLPGYPNVTPQPNYASPVEWLPTNKLTASALMDRAVVGGFEGYDHSPLWVIRARFEGDLIPGKFAVKHNAAYVPWGGKENPVNDIEVCCARPERVRWVESRDGAVPPNAIVAGNTASGEPLYVGRAKEQGSLTPGKVQPSHKNMYISFAGKELAHNVYEVLCAV